MFAVFGKIPSHLCTKENKGKPGKVVALSPLYANIAEARKYRELAAKEGYQELHIKERLQEVDGDGQFVYHKTSKKPKVYWRDVTSGQQPQVRA